MVPLVLQCVVVFDVPVESGLGPEHEFQFPEFVGHGDPVGAGAVSPVGHVHPFCVPHVVEFNPQAKSIPCIESKKSGKFKGNLCKFQFYLTFFTC